MESVPSPYRVKGSFLGNCEMGRVVGMASLCAEAPVSWSLCLADALSGCIAKALAAPPGSQPCKAVGESG